MIALPVVVGRYGEEFRHFVVGGERDLQGAVAVGGLREAGEEVALQCTLRAEGDVESQIERVWRAVGHGGRRRVLLGGIFAVARTDGALDARGAGEALEVGHAIAETDHDVVGMRLVEQLRSHGEREYACASHLDAGGEVVVEGHVDAEERREGLVEGDGRDIVAGRGGGEPVLHCSDESETIGHLAERLEGAVGSDAIETLVGVVEVEGLEPTFERGQLGETGVLERPARQQAAHGGEEVETASRRGIGVEEGGDHDGSGVTIHSAVGGIVGLSAPLAHAGGVGGAGVALFDLRAVLIEQLVEATEGGAGVAVVGIAERGEGGAERPRGHGERTVLQRGHARVHVLDGLRPIEVARETQVDFEVAEGLEGGANLQIFCARSDSGGDDAVGLQEPSTFGRTVHVAFPSDGGEGEV